MMKKMRVIDAPVKELGDFENEELFLEYLGENWQSVLIHNTCILSLQINALLQFFQGAQQQVNDQKLMQGLKSNLKIVS